MRQPLLYNEATINLHKYGAVRWAQSELFFRLLLKNTVCSPQNCGIRQFFGECPTLDAPIKYSFRYWSYLIYDNESYQS
jgi:hypothetical protein